MSPRPTSVPRTRALLLLAAISLACYPAHPDAEDPVGQGSSGPAAPDAGGDDQLATIALQLTTVPSDVRCLRAQLTGIEMAVRTVDVAAGGGSQTIAFPALPLGKGTVFFDAFNVACASVQPTTGPTWVAIERVAVDLVAGEPFKVSVDLRRPTSVEGSFDFVDAPKDVSLTPREAQASALLGGADLVHLTLRNRSTAIFTVPAPSLVGDTADFKLHMDECTDLKAVPPNGSCRYEIEFAPKTAGSRKVLLKVGGLYATVEGTAIDPGRVVFEPTSLDFGTVQLGTESKANLTLRNLSNTPFVKESLVEAFGAFSVVETTCGPVLAPNDSCRIVVAFVPVFAGTQVSDVFVGDLRAGLSGTGAGTGGVTFAPSSVFLGTVVLGSTTRASLRVTNTNPTAFPVMLSLDGGSDFHFDSSTCPPSLPAGASCDVQVRYQATKSVGARTIVSAGPGSFGASINAVVRVPGVTFSPPSFDFGNVTLYQTARKTFTITTDTTVALHISLSSGFEITPNSTCGTSLSAGQSCTVEVSVTPVILGPRSGELFIGDFLPTATVKVSGLSALTLLPAVGDFGNVALGQSRDLTFTLTNGGSTPVFTTVYFLNPNSADFQKVGGTCGGSVAGGASCTTIVRFTPAAARGRGSQLFIPDAEPVALAGVGMAGTVTVSPSPFDYGAVTVSQSASKTFTIANGTSATVVTSVSFAPAGDFSIDSAAGTCTGSVAPGGSCSLVVRFAPVSAGMKATTLTLGGAAATATLSGTGVVASAPITNLVVNDATGGVDGIANNLQWSLQGNFQAGVAPFGDRTVTVSSIGSASLAGKAWLRTAADSKSFTTSPLATFTLTGDTLFLLVDNRHNNATTGKPAFLDASYTDTGFDATVMEGTTARPYSVWKKSVASGSTVSLPAVSSGTAPCYFVVVQ
jgi:hypothetical protein